MKRIMASLVISVALIFACSVAYAASVPFTLTYQGSMFVDDEPFDGDGFFKMAVVESSGTSIWSNDGTSVGGSEPAGSIATTVNDGAFSIVLGNTAISGMDPIVPLDFDTNQTLLLKVWFDDGVNGFSELTPSLRITSSAYSFNSQLLQGFEPADFLLSTDQIQTTQIADDAVTPDKISAFTNSNTAFTVGRGQNDNVVFFADTAAANNPNLRYNVGTSKWQFSNDGVAWSDIGSGGVAPVTSVFGRVGAVAAAANDYTWAQVDKTVSSLADITTRSAGDLSSGNLGVARMPTGGSWNLTSTVDLTNAVGPPMRIVPNNPAPAGTAMGQIFVSNDGLLYLYDATRAKWLSANRYFVGWGRNSGNTTNEYLRQFNGASSNQNGWRMMRNGTIVGISAQTNASQTWTFEIRKNDVVAVITSLSINAANGGQDTTLNVDFSAGDFLQAYCNGASIDWPQGLVEIAWRQ